MASCVAVMRSRPLAKPAAMADDSVQPLPWVLFAALTLAFGQRIHDRIGAETYMRWLRGFLWAMVIMLIVQFTRLMIERFA